MLQHKAYCGRHSIEQRKVRDALNCLGEVDPCNQFFTVTSSLPLHSYVQAFRQQYGPEDVKSMKQMRVTHYLLKKDLYFASIIIGSTVFSFTNQGSNNLRLLIFLITCAFVLVTKSPLTFCHSCLNLHWYCVKTAIVLTQTMTFK